MTLRIDDIAPNFEASTTKGKINFHEWLGDSWGVIFSHPKDFTPVCTTELGYLSKLEPEFTKRNVKIIGLSVDGIENHEAWSNDILKYQGISPNYPIISDSELIVAKLYGMLPADAKGDISKRSPADNQTVRTVFVITPDKKIKLLLTYPMTTGRNFDEILRVIDSIQLTSRFPVATPVNWLPGDDVIIVPSISNDEANEKFPAGFKEHLPYLRTTKEPK